MKKLYLLRHAQSVANVQLLVGGTPDDPLSEEGRRQSQAAAGLRIKHNLSFTHCFVSHWRRAQETAQFFYPDGKFQVDQRLGELFAGDVATQRWDDIRKLYPQLTNAFNYNWAFPGGESRRDLFERCASWMHDIEQMDGEACILAVSHAGPIECILQYAFNIPPQSIPIFFPSNASLSLLTYGDDEYLQGSRKGWILRCFSLSDN